ncbi:MAG: hypothetical protein OEY75_06115 [Hylemonella sp.]|nr:hypothetical protein [Hylemonella sp.]
MNESVLSTNWYRVAGMRPQLRSHVRLHRMRFRGDLWYLLQDPASGRIHRFTPSARLLMAAMNGQRTVQQIWELGNRELHDDAPSQDEVIRLLAQLHGADLLQSDVMPDTQELFERGEKLHRQTRRKSYLNPMSIRFHLWDPDRFLNFLRKPIHMLWGRAGGLLWLVVVLPALMLLPSQWVELTGNFADRVLAGGNLLLLALVFPAVKALHELGHAVAIKRGGGEVHDIGIVLLVFIPVPYVEASASSVFKRKFDRAMVGAAGMVVELFVAAVAFYFWLLLEPSILRAVLFNVMLVASVSALLFNGNPLLRYDAYYILSDLIEMPNLAQRAMRYWGYLIERYAFGVKEDSPETARSDQIWLVVYGALSTLYRIFVTIAIALFVASGFFFIGVLLAVWAVVAMALLPLAKAARHLVTSPRLQAQRLRVWSVSGGLLLALFVGLFVVPVPFRSVAQGVAWLPESAQVRSAHAGFAREVVARPGSLVQAGDLLLVMTSPELEAEVATAQARAAELQAVYLAKFSSDRAQAAIAHRQWRAAEAYHSVQRERLGTLHVRAGSAGTFIVPQASDMPGRFYAQGELLGYVLDRPYLLARVVVQQETADLVRGATTAVQLRLAHRPEVALEGRLQREVPAGDEYLPSRVLAVEGGGQIATDPRDSHGARTLERTFQFDIEFVGGSAQPASAYFGERIHARFEHPSEPLAWQWYRGVRRLFLSQFHV